MKPIFKLNPHSLTVNMGKWLIGVSFYEIKHHLSDVFTYSFLEGLDMDKNGKISISEIRDNVTNQKSNRTHRLQPTPHKPHRELGKRF